MTEFKVYNHILIQFFASLAFAMLFACSPENNPSVVQEMKAVDLGLSVKWAECNLGAEKPEDYGDYYAWGEVEPYYSSQDPLTWKYGKTGYDWTSYSLCNGKSSTLTKYNTSSSFGTVDNKTVLEEADDVAHVKLGGKWRMPTDAEWTELRTNCTWTSENQNGVHGFLVTGPNGNSIFLPRAGSRSNTELNDVGSNGVGVYWSSSLDTNRPYYAWSVYLYYDPGERYDVVTRGDNGLYRYLGHSVRPVSNY